MLGFLGIFLFNSLSFGPAISTACAQETDSKKIIEAHIAALTLTPSAENEAKRKTAAEKLGSDYASVKAVNPLIKVLKDPKDSPMVRKASAEALGRLALKYPTTSAFNSLKNQLPIEKNSDIREGIVNGLSYTHDKRAIEILRPTLEKKSELPKIRMAALKALDELDVTPGPATVQKLMGYLKNDQENLQFRAAVAEALGDFADPAAIPVFTDVLKWSMVQYSQEKSPLLLGLAESILAAFGKYKGTVAEPVHEALLSVFEDRGAAPSIRVAAASALAKASLSERLAGLCVNSYVKSLGIEDFKSEVWWSAVDGLGGLKDRATSAVEDLRKILISRKTELSLGEYSRVERAISSITHPQRKLGQ